MQDRGCIGYGARKHDYQNRILLSLRSVFLVIAAMLLPMSGHAATSDYDGVWAVTLTCGAHKWLEKSQDGFVAKSEWTVINGIGRKEDAVILGQDKADIYWLFDVETGQAKL